MDCLIIIISRSRTCGGEDLFENGVNLGVGSRPSDRSNESLDACWFLTNIECIEEYLVVFLHFFYNSSVVPTVADGSMAVLVGTNNGPMIRARCCMMGCNAVGIGNDSSCCCCSK